MRPKTRQGEGEGAAAPPAAANGAVGAGRRDGGRDRHRKNSGGGRKSADIDCYLSSINHELLTQARELELAQRAEAGDRAARDELVGCNLRLVVFVARQYQNKGLDFDDLIAEGNLGLVKAADRFKTKFKTRFSTYATWWIKAAIRDALRSRLHLVRVPAGLYSQASSCLEARLAMTGELGRCPTDHEVFVALGVPVDRWVRLTPAMQTLERSRSERRGDPDRCAAVGDTPAQVAIGKEFEQRLLGAARRAGGRRSVEVMKLRYGLGGETQHTLVEAGQKLGLTRERVRQIQDEALAACRAEFHLPTPAQEAEEAADELVMAAEAEAAAAAAEAKAAEAEVAAAGDPPAAVPRPPRPEVQEAAGDPAAAEWGVAGSAADPEGL